MSSNARAFLKAQITSSPGTLALSGLLMLAQSGEALMVPWLGGELTTALTGGSQSTPTSLNVIFLALIALFSAQALLGFGYGYLLASTQEYLGARLRILVHDHVQSLPLTYHNEKDSGDLLTLLSHDIEVVCGFLAALAALSIPVFYLLSRRLNREVRASSEGLTRAQANTLTAAEEHFRLIPLIKAYSGEPATSKHFRDRTRLAMGLGKRQSFLLHRVQPLLQLVSITGLVCLLWLGSRMAVEGSLSTAALVSFFLYGALFARSMTSMASLYGQIQQTRVAVSRLLDTLDVSSEFRKKGRIDTRRASGRIEFRDVHFCYPGRRPLFTGLSFEMSAGETVAITGPNGAGKSTLASLLLRFYAPQQGTVLVDGTDISRMHLTCLREQIAWVSQAVLLFGGTVYENIVFGCRDKSRHAVEAAARAAQAHDFIRALPQGYDTVVGREAMKLSGGQRQRIALARALLKDAPILILDEATVMFDPRAEARFLENNRRYLSERTVIFITHHQENLEMADRVVKLDDGRLTDPAVDSIGAPLAAVPY
jgi:ABC-type multidrug transport system fused ATPase/permease subunit